MNYIVPIVCCVFCWLCGYFCNYFLHRNICKEKINNLELERRDFDVQLLCDDEVLCTYSSKEVDKMASWWARAYIDIQRNIKDCGLTKSKSVI